MPGEKGHKIEADHFSIASPPGSFKSLPKRNSKFFSLKCMMLLVQKVIEVA